MKNDGDAKNLTVETNGKTETSVQKKQQREDSHVSVTGRPDINEISKRNAESARQDAKSTYTAAGIIVLFIMIVMFLVYFFS